MKTSFKIPNMRTSQDIRMVKQAIASNEGILACEISKEKSEVSIVYDDYFTDLDKIIGTIEDLGYTVI